MRRPAAVMSVFGTRPEVIKFMPVLRELERRRDFRLVNVLTSQHGDLLDPFLAGWGIRVDYDLRAISPGQPLNRLLGKMVLRLDPVLRLEHPDLVLVQGDTTSALAGALAAHHRCIPVGHIEAGLRSGDRTSPFPEEINRRLISVLAQHHFAPTSHNLSTLQGEGVAPADLVQTGNPVIDAIHLVRDRVPPSPALRELLDRLRRKRIIVLTTHRRESLGRVMRTNLEVLRGFLGRHPDVALVFPVHPNPAVREVAEAVLGGVTSAHLIAPLSHSDFLHCVAAAWLVVSDSGGVQEEAPSLGKPLLVLRTTTERPEALRCGVARLVGDAGRLEDELESFARDDRWSERVRATVNPFGAGDSAHRIVDAIAARLAPGRPADEAVRPTKVTA